MCVGIVKSNVVLTFFQVMSRLLVLWGVVHGVPAVSIIKEYSHDVLLSSNRSAPHLVYC